MVWAGALGAPADITVWPTFLFWEFYLYAIKKDGGDLCAIKKVTRTRVPSS
jgi:hypothetical protein